MADLPHLKPPSRALLALEGRALWELGLLWQSLPALRLAPRGDGHPVLVLPGFIASDVSTTPLRWYLRDRGYETRGWNQGRNLGLRPGVEPRMVSRLRNTYRRYGQKVSLIGWSLGGIYARELARRYPEWVRQLITLGSPFNASSRANHAWQLYEVLSGETIDSQQDLLDKLRAPLPMPTTAVYSRTDGVVAWQCCLDDEENAETENVEVPGSHCGLGLNPMVFYIIADRLAQEEGSWQPFDRRALHRLFYPKPASGYVVGYHAPAL